MTERRHVYPVDDLREHVTEGTSCWCDPEVEDIDGGPGGEIVIHNSMDGRELYETGERLPS